MERRSRNMMMMMMMMMMMIIIITAQGPLLPVLCPSTASELLLFSVNAFLLSYVNICVEYA